MSHSRSSRSAANRSRTAAGTQSRTEVVADQVVPSRYAKKVAAAIARAHQVIDDSGIS